MYVHVTTSPGHPVRDRRHSAGHGHLLRLGAPGPPGRGTDSESPPATLLPALVNPPPHRSSPGPGRPAGGSAGHRAAGVVGGAVPSGLGGCPDTFARRTT